MHSKLYFIILRGRSLAGSTLGAIVECATALSRVRLFRAHLTRALLSSQVGSAWQLTSLGSEDDMRALFQCPSGSARVCVADSLEMTL